MIPGTTFRRRFRDLSEQEILALAISSEEDDARIYRSYAQRLQAEFPASAAVFNAMALLMSSGGTSSTTNPRRAGLSKALAKPSSNANT